MEIWRFILASAVSVIVLFAIAKLMGHKQVAQLDFFDYISGITIGSLAAELAIEPEHFASSLVALAIYFLTSLTLNFVTKKFPRTRKYINGTPTILFNNGTIYRENLKKAKLDLSEFMLLCRERGFFDLGQIQTAIFEHNGKITVLPKAENRPATPSDFNMTPAAEHIGTELIMDGRVMGENLERLGKDEAWLNQQIRAEGVQRAADIFLAIYHEAEDTLTIYK